MTSGPDDRRSTTSDWRNRLPHQAVRDELQRILASPEFLASEKRRRFLSFVVEETLSGRADQLKGYTIATAVFGRGKDFDPAHDPIVRIQAAKLRRDLERYYLVVGESDPIRIDIPKGRYVPFIVETPEADPAMDAAAAASRSSRTPATPSVAVMPLANLTTEPNQVYFLDGLVSELTMELGRYQDITAISCTGAAATTDTPAEMKNLASTLGARFLLGGTLRRDSETAKVTLQLTDAATGLQVWSDSYRERLKATEMIATQERIARDVVGTIAGELGIISQNLSRESRKKPPSELTTYEAMLRYHHYMRTTTEDSYKHALAALRAAVEREPEYGPAWSALANLFNHAHIRDLPGIEDPLATAAEYAHKGVILEPGSQLTRTVMAYVHLLQGDRESVLEEARIALSLNPNSLYFAGTIGYILVFAGEFERGRLLIDKAIALNPCHPRWFHHACWLDDYRRGEYEASYRQASLVGPILGYWNPALCAASLGQLGRRSEANAYVEELRRLKPDFESRARELVSGSLRIEDLTERIIDGLRKAGLKIENPP
jgi:TolB-like protein